MYASIKCGQEWEGSLSDIDTISNQFETKQNNINKQPI